MESPAYLTLGSTSDPMRWGLFVSMACPLSKPGNRFREAQRPTEDGQPWGALGTQQTLFLVTQQGERAGAELHTLWVSPNQCSPTSTETTRAKVSLAPPALPPGPYGCR